MGILPDYMLHRRGRELIIPFDSNAVQPASIDLHLDSYFHRLRKREGWTGPMDVSKDNSRFWDAESVPRGKTTHMAPDEFLLASTYEKIIMPKDLVARFEGKSSLGRQGLITHVTAGFIDPGFEGHITLELKNVTPYSIELHPGMKIGQICFEELVASVLIPYGSYSAGSHYQNQRGPTLSRSHLNFNKIDVYDKRK